MAPKKPNSKAAAALEKKAANEALKNAKENEQKERMESEKWSKGSRDTSSREREEEKKKELLAKKAERQALLDAEEAELAAKKPLLRGANKKAAQKSSGIDAAFASLNVGGESYAASGIDAALDLLDAASKSGPSANPDKVEKHPERRMKSAYAAFEERELPILKADNPGLRLSQLKQMLQKKWKKSPENPMNQEHVAFDASKEEIKEKVQSRKEDTLAMYKE